MQNCCAAANLPHLFTGGSVPEEIKELWPFFEQAFQADNRGTRLSDILAFGVTPAQVKLASKRQSIPSSAMSLVMSQYHAPASGTFALDQQ